MTFFSEEKEFKSRSQAIQRNLPRPFDINNSILRPTDLATPLTDLQKAEELIKKEMLIMLHYDAIKKPCLLHNGLLENQKKTSNYALADAMNDEKNNLFLAEDKYETFTDQEINQVKHFQKIPCALSKRFLLNYSIFNFRRMNYLRTRYLLLKK